MTSSFVRLLSSVALVILVGIGYGIGYDTLANESAKAAELSASIDAKAATQNRAAAARAALEELASDETAVGKYFVSTDTVVGFLTDLESRGTELGADVKVLSVSAVTNAGHPALQVALTINGTFPAVMNTIGRIEYAPYAIATNTLSLTGPAPTADASAKEWAANMTLMVGSLAPTVGNTLPTPPSATSSIQSSGASSTRPTGPPKPI